MSSHPDPRILELHDLLVLEEDARGNPYCLASQAEARSYREEARRLSAELACAEYGMRQPVEEYPEPMP